MSHWMHRIMGMGSWRRGLAQLFPCLAGMMLDAYDLEKVEFSAMVSLTPSCNILVIGRDNPCRTVVPITFPTSLSLSLPKSIE